MVRRCLSDRNAIELVDDQGVAALEISEEFV
jgi:hypothetical protein